MHIKRYLSETNLKSIDKVFKQTKDFKNKTEDSYIAIRNDPDKSNEYMDIYYKGNAVKIDFYKRYINRFKISLHNKFLPEKLKNETSFGFMSGAKYAWASGDSYFLSDFLTHLDDIKKMIDRSTVRNREIEYEVQILISNSKRSSEKIEKFFFIDRQITENRLGIRLDLLGLRQIEGNRYKFVVVELKRGKNRDLDGEVVEQLNKGLDYLSNADTFEAFKNCYEINYTQQKSLELPGLPKFDSIEIETGVEGLILVVEPDKNTCNKIRKIKENKHNIFLLEDDLLLPEKFYKYNL